MMTVGGQRYTVCRLAVVGLLVVVTAAVIFSGVTRAQDDFDGEIEDSTMPTEPQTRNTSHTEPPSTISTEPTTGDTTPLTITTPPPITTATTTSDGGPHQTCSSSFGFDLTFLNRSQHELISIYESESGHEVCEIDALVDRILPPDYEVARNFSLSTASKVAHINDTFATLNRLVHLASGFRETFAPVLQRVATRFSFLLYELQLSPQCLRSMLTIMGAVRRNEFWAMKFMDASGRLPSGMLEGVLSSVGDYEECLHIRSPEVSDGSNQTKSVPFTGQYCWAQPVIPHPDRGTYLLNDQLIKDRFSVPPRLVDEIIDALHLLNGSFLNIGLCLPSTCSPNEIETAVNTVLYPITQIPIRIGPECVTQKKRETIKYTFGGLFALTLLASFYEFALTDLGVIPPPNSNGTNTGQAEIVLKMNDRNNNNTTSDTSFDTGSSKPKKPQTLSLASRLIISFSLVGNTRAMFKVSAQKFAVIDFVRFLMLCEIILMHQYYVALGWSAWPLTKRFVNGLVQQVGTDFRYAFLRNIHNTDFFFALSGLLLTYSTVGSLERRKGRFNYLSFALNMYLRFYPAVLGTILLFYLLPLLGDGPFWHMVDRFHVQSCRDNLVANLLTYNFYTLDMESFYRNSMCNIASWWVTSCFHLILLSPLLLVPLYHSSQALWLVAGSVIVGSVVSVGHIWWRGIPFMNQMSLMNSIFEESFYSIFYTWPFIHHIAPFALGVAVGYLIRRHPRLNLGGWFGELLLTVVFVGLTCMGFYWTQDMLKSETDLTSLLTGVGGRTTTEIYLNITVGKLMFVAGFLWIFYLGCTGRSALLTSLCTWPGLQPLYSLSMGLYLTNFIPPLFTTFSVPDVVEFTDFHILKTSAFNFSFTVVLAYVVHVLFEKPVMNVLKIVESG